MASRKKKTSARSVTVKIENDYTEKDIESIILDWINRNPNGFAFKINTMGVYDKSIGGYRKTGKYTLKGTSDILGIWHGAPLAIEVKKIGGRVSDDQKAFLKKYYDRGGIAFVAYSLEEVKRHLEYFSRHQARIRS